MFDILLLLMILVVVVFDRKSPELYSETLAVRAVIDSFLVAKFQNQTEPKSLGVKTSLTLWAPGFFDL